MLDHGQVMEGLRSKAEKFHEQYDQKDYLSAMWTYNEALVIAVFLKLNEEDMKEIFGNRSYVDEHKEERKEGLFQETQVEYARLWCIRNNKTRQEIVDTRLSMAKK